MTRHIVTAILIVLLAAACGAGPAGGTHSPAGTPLPGAGEEASGEPPGAPAPGIPCETSDDCASGQICVDSECAIPVPAGFY
jgi:hypothetical protein